MLPIKYRQLSDDSIFLLHKWLNAKSLNESKAILKANAELLLANKVLWMLYELRDTLADEGTDFRETVLKHLAIVEKARAGSVDAAYTDLAQFSPVARTFTIEELCDALICVLQANNMDELPKPSQIAPMFTKELRDAFYAVLQSNSMDELLEQINLHPVLLTNQAVDLIGMLLDEVKQTMPRSFRSSIDTLDDRYLKLQDAIEFQKKQHSLDLALEKFLDADTPHEFKQVIAQHLILFEEETLATIAEGMIRAERQGDMLLARRIQLRLNELKRVRHHDEWNLHEADSYEFVSNKIGRVKTVESIGTITIGTNSNSPIIQNNLHVENYSRPPKQWQTPRHQRHIKPFVGRLKQLDLLRNYLTQGNSSATIWGMAGAGKTSLARQLAIDLHSSFPGGVIWIDVGPNVTTQQETQRLLKILAEYAFGGQLPLDVQMTSEVDPNKVAAWLEEVAPKPLFVVFDNVWYQEPLRLLAQALPVDAVCLVTTRYANVAQTLQGLSIQLNSMEPADGLALLEERLKCQNENRYRPLMEKLVNVLDGHALALNIAAQLIASAWQNRRYAQARVQTVQTILDDLENGFGRGQLSDLQIPPSEASDENLEKSLAISYNRMTNEQRSRFRALGVFATGTTITIEAAAAVWDIDDLNIARKSLTDLSRLAMLEEVEELEEISIADEGSIENNNSGQNKSEEQTFVPSQEHGIRIVYRQHSLLQVYACALLEKEGELANASWAWTGYYIDFALRVVTANPPNYSMIDSHLQNLKKALKWADMNEPLLFARLLDALAHYLGTRGEATVLETYLPKAVNVAASSGIDWLHAGLLRELGNLKLSKGHLKQARTHYEMAMPLARSGLNYIGEANVHVSLGILKLGLQDLDEAQNHFKIALDLFRNEQNLLGQANVLKLLGNIESSLGNFDQSKNYYADAVLLDHSADPVLSELDVLRNKGYIEMQCRNFNQARDYFHAALRLVRDNKRYRPHEALLNMCLGELEKRFGNFDKARNYFHAALPIFQDYGFKLCEIPIYMGLADIFSAEEAWDHAKNYYEQVLSLFDAEYDLPGQATTLYKLAKVRFELGDQQQGIQDVQQAITLFRSKQLKGMVYRAELLLIKMQMRLKQRPADTGETWSHHMKLLDTFIDLVELSPSLLTDNMLAIFFGEQADEGIQHNVGRYLESLKRIKALSLFSSRADLVNYSRYTLENFHHQGDHNQGYGGMQSIPPNQDNISTAVELDQLRTLSGEQSARVLKTHTPRSEEMKRMKAKNKIAKHSRKKNRKR